MSAQVKEILPKCEMVTIFIPEEIEKFKSEAFSKYLNGKSKYQQTATYILMLMICDKNGNFTNPVNF